MLEHVGSSCLFCKILEKESEQNLAVSDLILADGAQRVSSRCSQPYIM